MAEKKDTAAKALTKSETYVQIATATGLNRKQVAAVFEELGKLISKQLKKKGPGIFTIPGLLKLRRIDKPARKAERRYDPFKKEERMFPAKPASSTVRARPLKGLKDLLK
jgi:nucleoid DNA-binding protein